MPPRGSGRPQAAISVPSSGSEAAGAQENGRASKRARQPHLGKQTYLELKARIVCGELAPGSVITGYDLSRELGVSRTPVNDALKMLCAEGLAKAVPRVGYIVAPITLADVEEVFELRLVLEPLAVHLAVDRCSDADLQDFGRTYKKGTQQRARAAASDARHDAAVHDVFHRRVAGLSGNHHLVNLIFDLLLRSRRMRMRANRLALDRVKARAVSRHAQLVNALVSRDRAAAIEHMAEHIRESRDDIVAAMAEGEVAQRGDRR